jgi:hypothetical protein
VTDAVVWWVDPSDGAAHAIPRTEIGRGHVMLRTMCSRILFAYRVERHDEGPKCYACRLVVGPG